MPITRMSSEIPRILDGHRQMTLHSAFGSSLNLRSGQRLVNCAAGAISIPYGIEMAPTDVGRLQRLLCTTPSDLLEWSPLDRAIRSRTGRVVVASLPETTVFETALPVARSSSLHGSASALVAHLARTRASTGFGNEWHSLTTDPALTGAVESLVASRVDEAVIHWLGRGVGLTPSGDDVLVGMIAALQFMGLVDSSNLARLRELIDMAGSCLTTDISAEYLHYACRGMATGMVRDLLVALDRSDTGAVLDAVNGLRRHGHTSGMDCVLGVVMALI